MKRESGPLETEHIVRYRRPGQDYNTDRNRYRFMAKRQNQSKMRPKDIEGSKERLLIMTQTHNLKIWAAIPFVKTALKQQLNGEKR